MDIAQILNNVGFDWRVALANFANFLIIFYLLKRFAFGHIVRILEERKRRIAQGVEDASRSATSRQMAEQEYEQRVAQARTEANGIISEARHREESIVAKANERALVEARRVTNEAKAKIEVERVAMEREVRERASEVIVRGVEKLLRQEMTPERNAELIKKAIV